MSKLFLGIALASTAIWSVRESSADPVRDTCSGPGFLDKGDGLNIRPPSG